MEMCVSKNSNTSSMQMIGSRPVPPNMVAITSMFIVLEVDCFAAFGYDYFPDW